MFDYEPLNEGTFLLYAAKHYDNPQCYDVLEFEEDLKRFKYIKRLLNKYKESGELRERLILNHIIALNNVFGPAQTTKMLFFKLEGYEEYLVPFLSLLGTLPSRIYGIGVNNLTIYVDEVVPNKHISNVLKDI